MTSYPTVVKTNVVIIVVLLIDRHRLEWGAYLQGLERKVTGECRMSMGRECANRLCTLAKKP